MPSSWPRPLRWLLAGAGACLAALCYVGDAGLIAWIVFVPLFWVAWEGSVREAFFWGWLYGFVAWCAGFSWFFPTIVRFLRVPWPLAAALYVALCAFQGLMLAAVAGIPRLIDRSPDKDHLRLAVLSVLALVCADGYFPKFLPILLAGTQTVHLPMLQSLELFGPAGLAWLIAGFNAAAYLALRSRRWPALALMAVLVLANEGYGRRRIGSIEARAARAPAYRVGLVQGAIPVEDKLKSALYGRNLGVHRGLSEEALAAGHLDLLVWPETSYERIIEYDLNGGDPLPGAIRGELPYSVSMLNGAYGRSGGRNYNIAFVTSPGRRFEGLIEKRHRMLFGDYMPFGESFPRLYRLDPNSRRISRGRGQRLLEAGAAKLGVVICYEDLLPGYVRRYGDMGADLLVDMTNDAWMAESLAPELHLRYSALRAIENRRFLIRAVNSGVSAVVDPVGRVLRRIPPRERGQITETVALLDGKTVYVRLGDLLYRLAAVILLAAAWILRR